MASVNPANLEAIARQIRLVLTDCDGVLTDGGVYYSARGEEMKRFCIRDGMGVERLRQLCGIETGIVTGESSISVAKRAEKLKIHELHLYVKDKAAKVREIAERLQVQLAEIAYIGDDTNDIEIMRIVGLPVCPADATIFARKEAIWVCENKGGQGAFRDLAEFIIAAKLAPQKDKTDL